MRARLYVKNVKSLRLVDFGEIGVAMEVRSTWRPRKFPKRSYLLGNVSLWEGVGWWCEGDGGWLSCGGLGLGERTVKVSSRFPSVLAPMCFTVDAHSQHLVDSVVIVNELSQNGHETYCIDRREDYQFGICKNQWSSDTLSKRNVEYSGTVTSIIGHTSSSTRLMNIIFTAFFFPSQIRFFLLLLFGDLK